LRSLVQLLHHMDNHAEVITILDKIRSLSESPGSRLKLSTQIGDVLLHHLGDPQKACESYQNALEEVPDDIGVLEKLRRAQLQSEQYEQAIITIENLTRLIASEPQRARYLRMIGDIYRERLDMDERALKYYLHTLVLTPLDKRAFESAERILNRMRDWPKLAVLFEQIVKRTPPPIAGQEDRRIHMFLELIQIYRYQLQNNEAAIAACERLLAIQPKNVKVLEDLSRLYEECDRLQEAISLHRILIRESPFSVDSYHALRRIYDRLNLPDRSLCLSSTLVFLGEAREEEQNQFRGNRKNLPVPAGKVISEELYSHNLLHPQASGILGDLFSFAAEVGRSLFVVEKKEHRLKPKERIDLNNPPSKIFQVFKEALDFLGLEEPEIAGAVKEAIELAQSKGWDIAGVYDLTM